ncbi:MAG: putative bifunctional diguanylate cyclase/phosphodiesterase [Methylomonas sp.]
MRIYDAIQRWVVMAGKAMVNELKYLNILFVEDSVDDSELLIYQFRKAGYQLHYQRVETADCYCRALESASWHAVLCDHSMPHFDLMSAIDILKRKGLNIPLIIVSGSIPDHVMIEAMRAGAQDFIRKGDFARLLPVIEREVREASIRDGLREAEENLHRVVNYDAPTGLPNREHLLRNIRRMSAESGTALFEFSLVIIRLNHLPQSCFSQGEGMHKELIRNVAGQLKELLDEEAVYIIGRDCLGAIKIGLKPKCLENSLTDLIEFFSHPFELDGQMVFADCSVGVSSFPENGANAEEVLLAAEMALEHTDIHGVMPLRFYSPEMKTHLEERSLLENGIYRALARKEFFILFQPQVNIKTREITGVESLLRWNHPELGIVSPLKFIPLLERTGLIIPVGEWVLRESCRQCKEWMDQMNRPIKVAVNLSVVQFYKNGLIASVAQALKDSGLPSYCLELEITEDIAICHEDATLKILSQLKAMGVSLSIDDFGTGYSSLAYLQRYPINLLKIDQSFVRPMQSKVSRNADMLRAIIALGHNLNLDVLAEGIETQEQADFVLQQGCNSGQGYLFARPMEGRSVLSAIRNGDLMSLIPSGLCDLAQFPHTHR